jgi:type I restriction enzyme S subunit
MKYKKYPKYKDSGVEWIGEIPEEWEVNRLKYIFYFKKGKNAQKYTNEFVLNNPGKFPVFSGDTKDDGIIGKIDSYQYDTDDVIFVTTVGANAMYSRKISGKFSLSQNCAILIPKKNSTNVDYFSYLLQHIFLYEKGKISLIMQPSLRFQDLNQYYIVMSTSEEEKQIAKFLEKQTTQFDELIAKSEAQITLLEEKRQATITQAVTKGLDPSVPMKDSGVEWIGEIPEGWEVKRLKFTCKINPSKSEIQKISDDELVSFLPMELVSEEGELELGEIKRKDEVYSGFTYFRNDDVIVAKITPCFENGKGALCQNLKNGVGFGSTEFHVLRALNGTNPKFLYHLTRSNMFKKIGESMMFGAAGQKRVPTDFIQNFVFGLPPIEEQIQISEFLDKQTTQFDELIAKSKAQITLLEEKRQALITATVTGKIDVRSEVVA